MGCKSSKKEEFDKKIIQESCGLINQLQLDNFYMSYNFTQNEMLTIIDEYKKLSLNKKGLINPENLLDFPPFHYSPFGYHLLDALELNDKDDSFTKKEEEKNTKDKLNLKEKNSKKKSKKNKKRKKGEEDEALTNEELITDIQKIKEDENDGKSLGIQDFVYYVYLFSSHSKILERAQLYFKLFDFDNDGKITPSDLIIYLENLDKDSEEVLKETKKFFNKERKINKDDYIMELGQFKSAKDKKQIANLIIKESCSKGKNYIDFFDFRNMYLTLQFIPEYYCPLYLEEKFNDGRVGGSNKNNVTSNDDDDKDININETQGIDVHVKSDEEDEKDEGKKGKKKEKKGKDGKILKLDLDDEEEDE